ncbi:MAG: glycosyltransferase family 39 protein [Planctomyces sp.]|nr:glycosyltransferase family 39 protein [Planctomyces sp.]
MWSPRADRQAMLRVRPAAMTSRWEREKNVKTQRHEVLIVLLISLMGFVLRWVEPDRMAVEHFDEGVYASVLWHDSLVGTPYPSRHLYAPPLLSALISLSDSVTGNSEIAPFLPALILGSLTVPLFWRVTRDMFGSVAGLFGAGLIAMSDFHIQYSRMAMTDVPVLFFMLLAIWQGLKGIERDSMKHVFAGGLSCGIAWWFKYTGWLPIAILWAGVGLWWLWAGRRQRRILGLIRLGMVFAGTAFVVWLPWWIALQSEGGYSAVAANHAGFLQGWKSWMPHFIVQLTAQFQLDGLTGSLSVGLGLIVAGFARWLKLRSFTWNFVQAENDTFPPVRLLFRFGLAGLAMSVIALSIPTPLLLTCAGLGGVSGVVLWKVLQRLYDRRHREDLSPVEGWRIPLTEEDLRWSATIDPQIGVSIVAVWFLSMLVVTPLYHPYPRLMFPFLGSVWLGASAGVGWWIESNLSVARREMSQRVKVTLTDRLGQIVAALLTFCVVISVQAMDVPFHTNIYEDRSTLRGAAMQVAELCRNDAGEGAKEIVVYAFGEPAFLYHLNRGGEIGVPVADLSVQPVYHKTDEVPTYLVFGPYAKTSDRFWDSFLRETQRFEHLGDVEFRPGTAVQFDLFTPRYLVDHPELLVQKLEVYRIHNQ